ncbi:MAG: hypothetical protein AAF098_18310, partial [Pseudomonadota bacterium]
RAREPLGEPVHRVECRAVRAPPPPVRHAPRQWFTVHDLPPIPPATSIAGQLIREHCRRYKG